jgi:transcription initiation factor IIE alpha subunit
MAKELSEQGYNKEEEYFYKKNRELIEKRRRDLDAQRSKQQTQADRTVHWMKCPKCGGDLKEVEMSGIKLDQCASCEGIYFDRGELELLIESQEQKGLLGGLKRLFR